MVRRNPWLLIILGIFGIGSVVGTGVWAYWSYANQVPAYTPPRVVMPVPNAYDDYQKAGAMSQAAGGSAVLQPGYSRPGLPALPPGPYGSPGPVATPGVVMRNGLPLEGYDGAASLEQVRAVVARNRSALAQLRRGFQKTYLSPPIVSSREDFPSFVSMRALARALLTEGKLAEREGRMRDAARSYLDCLRLGVDVPRGGPLVHGLTGIAIQAIGLDALDRSADRMEASTLTAAAQEMLRLGEQAPTAADALTAEKEYGTASMTETLRQRLSLRQIATMVSSDPSGEPSPRDYLRGLRFGFTPKRQMLGNYRSHMDALIADARKPYFAPRTLPPLPSDPLNQIMPPDWEHVRFRWDMNEVHWRVLELRLSAQAYRLRHGTPSPSADALVPKYLPAIPRDPFADKPLVYRVRGGTLVIYSRGPDGDDDGGRDLGLQAQPGQDGDIVTTRVQRPGSGRGG